MEGGIPRSCSKKYNGDKLMRVVRILELLMAFALAAVEFTVDMIQMLAFPSDRATIQLRILRKKRTSSAFFLIPAKFKIQAQIANNH